MNGSHESTASIGEEMVTSKNLSESRMYAIVYRTCMSLTIQTYHFQEVVHGIDPRDPMSVP